MHINELEHTINSCDNSLARYLRLRDWSYIGNEQS